MWGEVATPSPHYGGLYWRGGVVTLAPPQASLPPYGVSVGRRVVSPPPLRIMGVSMGGGNVVTPSPQHHPLPIGFLWGQVRSSPHTLWGFYGWGEEW